MAALSASSGMLAHQHQQYQAKIQQHQQQPMLVTGKTIPTSFATSPSPIRSPSSSTFSASPRQSAAVPPEAAIAEEGGESGSESAIEPVTPTSGRQSGDFSLQGQSQDLGDDQLTPIPINSPSSPSYTKAADFVISQSLPAPTSAFQRRPSNANTLTTATTNIETPNSSDNNPAFTSTPLSRQTTRGSVSNIKRAMSSLFRRSNTQIAKDSGSAIVDTGFSTASESGYTNTTSNTTSNTASRSSFRRFSTNRSSAPTRSNSPPSPGLEMAPLHRERPPPSSNDSVTSGAIEQRKKNRASTGLTLRGRAINFVGATVRGGPNARPAGLVRRASSFDGGSRPTTPQAPHNDQDEATYPPERLPWARIPESGTGVKARRLSISLPDDFAVDVAELQAEFDYQSKFLGRHGKHLGKGAASKVTLMMRKGFPEELYAVKEFRGKSRRESQDEYEKKIKSEFSIAKSLHHPNIIETFRLCTSSGRWNHVMEYCSEGDLFSLVQKGYLKSEDRKKDRLCLFKQLIQGVHYLHSNGIAHRDIKLENLLITKDSKLKITDFGVSEVFSGIHPGLREAGGQCGREMGDIRLCSPGICGSEPYIAPEVLNRQEKYDARALDVWSSAIVMIYLIFGGAIWNLAQAPQNPQYELLVRGWKNWYKKHESDPEACITDTDYPKFAAFDTCVSPPALRRVLLQMLNPDPVKRSSIADVVNNRWMKNVECCQVESYEDPALTIDATKREATKNGTKKIFCHNHLPLKAHGHSLGKMPGQAGY